MATPSEDSHPRPPGVIVLGMHRSGTSLATRLLVESGFTAGEREELLSPNDANSEGYWERTDVVLLNEWLLRVLPPHPKPLSHPLSSWDGWLYGVSACETDLPGGARETLAAFQERLFARLAALNGPWVLKDPRLCLTLPLWRRRLADAVPVLVTRNPVEVARSLARRDGLSFQHGLALWEAYNRAAFHFTAGAPRVVVQFEDLRRDPEAELARLTNRLRELGFPNARPPENMGALVRSDLVHHLGETRSHEALVPAELTRLATRLTGPERITLDPGLEPGPAARLFLEEYRGTESRNRERESEVRRSRATVERAPEILAWDEEVIDRQQGLIAEYAAFGRALSGSLPWRVANRMLKVLYHLTRADRSTPEDMLRQLETYRAALPPPRPRPVPRGTSVRCVVVLACHNEERFLDACLENYHSQGLETYLLDNQSTDRSVAVAERHLGKGLLGIESVPRGGIFSWADLLREKQRVFDSLDCDWVMLADPDEIRRAPPGFGTLRDWITLADREGFNALNFHEFTFIPVRESPDHDHDRFVETMRWYYPFLTNRVRQLKCWKRFGQPVELLSSGGHLADFPGLHRFPESGILRHYMCLSVEQAARKYGGRNFCPEERARGWHTWRHGFSTDLTQLPSAADLRYYIDDAHLDPDNPRHEHWLRKGVGA